MGLPYAKALPGEKPRSEEHTSELQSPCNLVGHLVISYAVFCLKKKKRQVFRLGDDPLGGPSGICRHGKRRVRRRMERNLRAAALARLRRARAAPAGRL